MDNVSNRGWVRENILPIIAAVAVIIAVGWIWYDYKYRTAPVDNFSSYQSEANLPEPSAARSSLVSTQGWARVNAPFGVEIPYPSELTPFEFGQHDVGFNRGPVEDEFIARAPIVFSVRALSPQENKNQLLRGDIEELLSETTETFSGTQVLHFTGRRITDELYRPGAEDGYLIFPLNEMQSVIVSYYAEDAQMAAWARAMAADVLSR